MGAALSVDPCSVGPAFDVLGDYRCTRCLSNQPGAECVPRTSVQSMEALPIYPLSYMAGQGQVHLPCRMHMHGLMVHHGFVLSKA